MTEEEKKEYRRLLKLVTRGHITDEEFENKCLELFKKTPEEIEEEESK